MNASHHDDRFTAQDPWLDLVNSRQWDGFGNEVDHLREPKWVRRYLGYWPALRATLNVAAAPAQLAALRDTLRGLAERGRRGVILRRKDLHILNEFLAAPGFLQLSMLGKELKPELVPVRSNWAWVRARIAQSFVDACEQDRQRIKYCDNEQCRWVFFDRTKSNNRRWCKDRRCGNRDRVRRARARQAGG